MRFNHFQSKLGRRSVFFISCAFISTAVMAGIMSDTRGGSINNGVHLVNKDSKSTDSNDPRAESHYSEGLTSNSSTNEGTFTADYNVVSAHRTTIAQVLHCNSDLADKCRPVLFLTVYKKDGKVTLCSKDCGPNNAGFGTTPDSTFKVTITASRSSATVKVTDTNFSKSSTVTYPTDRANNGNYTMRFGAYHHHTGRYDWSQSSAPARPKADWPNPPKAFSKAEIGVSNASWTRK
ncbi:MAG: hypothetical protein HC843_03015 [Sphingomonadales bacterium]|nr:hypothetical protein [Sphingomonadales bacterium]